MKYKGKIKRGKKELKEKRRESKYNGWVNRWIDERKEREDAGRSDGGREGGRKENINPQTKFISTMQRIRNPRDEREYKVPLKLCFCRS